MANTKRQMPKRDGENNSAVPLLFIRYLKSKVCTHYRYGLKSLISSCYNGQVSGAAYCNRAVQQAAQRRVQIMSTTASHQPAAL